MADPILDQLADHEARILALEADDAAIKSSITPVMQKVWAFVSSPWVSRAIAALAMAALLWMAAKFGIVLPPVPVGQTEKVVEQPKTETPKVPAVAPVVRESK